jgi:hypothetical protein
MTRYHCAFAIPTDLPPNVQISNAKRQIQLPANAVGAGKSDSMAAQMQPEGRSAAPGSDERAGSWVRMLTCCTGGNRQRMQDVAGEAKAWLRKCSPEGGVQRWVLSGMQLGADADLLHRNATGSECGLLRERYRKDAK